MRLRKQLMPFVVALLAAFALGGGAYAANSLSIGSGSGPSAVIPVTMTADGDVQGFVLAIGYDATQAEVLDVSVAGTATEAAGADFVVPEILPAENGFTLGVVVDSTGSTGATIPGDPAQAIAVFAIRGTAPLACGATADIPLTFVDGTLNSPVLSNIIVIAGRSIGAPALALNDGLYTAVGPCDTIALVGEEGECDETVAANVLMNNANPVQGFVLSVAHDGAVGTLVEVHMRGSATEFVGPEFSVANVYPDDGGTLGVVLDFTPPFDGQTIPVGEGQQIATFEYEAKDCPECTDPPQAPQTMAVAFVDNVFGSPLLENVLVVAGLSRSPDFVDGEVTFTCNPIVTGTTFYVGSKTEGKPGTIDCAEGKVGGTATVGFYYTSFPAQGLSGMIQGLSITSCLPCEKASWLEDTFTIEGTITEALGAEFVNWHTENEDPPAADADDACELVVGILLDAVPPFQDQRYPITPDGDPLEVGRIDVQLADDLPCNDVFEVSLCNGIDGAGTVLLENRASIDNQSVAVELVDGCIRVDGAAAAEFIRADCNWDTLVDIADPAATINALFVGEFIIPCYDACDSNDDGRVDLADAVITLEYLFHFGDAPPDPGPLVAGPDPSEDRLDCQAGADAACP